MALQNTLGKLPPYVSNDINNTFAFLSESQVGSSAISLPFNTSTGPPTLRFVQRSYMQFIIPLNQPSGWFQGIAFKGVGSAIINAAAAGVNTTVNYSIFTGPRLRAAIMDTDNSMWLDNVNNTSLPRNILATISTGPTWAQAALNAIPSSITGTTTSQMFAFPFDNPVYLNSGTLYWIQMLVEYLYPTNGAGVFTGPDNYTPLIYGHGQTNNAISYVLINNLYQGPFFKNVIEGDGLVTGLNQLNMESGTSTYKGYGFVGAQSSIANTAAICGASLFNTPNLSNFGQVFWTPFLWRL